MHIHDVLIIGAGPCGLAAAARLREHTPSATFTDDEHQRYHWIRKHGQKMNIKDYRKNTDSLTTSSSGTKEINSGSSAGTKNGGLDMLVLDADGANWMTKWNRLFKTFGIEHLRSPIFFHVDPADRDALLGYAYEKGRESELQALPGCTGKEVSKHRKKKKLNSRGRISQSGPDVDERDRKDYYTPSKELFGAHCEDVTKRYALSPGMIQQEKVENIEYDDLSALVDTGHDSVISDDEPDSDKKVFRVTTDKGSRYAHVVVLAIGPGNAPSIPKICGLSTVAEFEGYSHAMRLKAFPPPQVAAKIKKTERTNMLIVGGGLTSIQLADLALKRGVSKVWLLMRGGVKVKYFDVDLDWVGKFRNFNQAAFWSADSDEERFEMIFHARNGGSITPRYRKMLDAHVARGMISLHIHTLLQSVRWDASTQTWKSIVTQPMVDMPAIDYIVFASGIQSNIETIPCLDNIRREYPIEYVGGLPCLNDDLMWCDDVPLFVTGRLAGLRLGPGAPNLVGARVGAERIAWNVQDVLEKMGKDIIEGSTDNEGGQGYDQKLTDYASGRRNRFDSLVDASST